MIKNPVVEAEMEQSEKAKLFRALHKGPKLLVLPNCWDAISAKVFAHSGAQAVATASASISWARGVRDGEGLSLGDMIDAVALCNGKCQYLVGTWGARRGGLEPWGHD